MATKKLKLFKSMKEVKRDIVPVLTTTGARCGAFTGTKALCNFGASKIIEKKDPATVGTDTETFYEKAVGPAGFVIGTLITAFAAEPHVAAIGQGMAVAGWDKSTNDFISEEKRKKVFLGATDNYPEKVNGQFDPKTKSEYDQKIMQMAAEAEAQAEIDRINRENNVENPTNFTGTNVQPGLTLDKLT